MPRMCRSLEILSIPAPLVPANLYLLGDQREKGRDSFEATRYADRLFGPQTKHPIVESPIRSEVRPQFEMGRPGPSVPASALPGVTTPSGLQESQDDRVRV